VVPIFINALKNMDNTWLLKLIRAAFRKNPLEIFSV